MSIIKQHLDRELSKAKKDSHIISELTKILDKNVITFREWQNSGRFIPAESFRKECPDTKIEEKCTDVVLYFGDIFIQVLDTDTFFIYPNYSSNDLKVIEKELWDNNAENFF